MYQDFWSKYFEFSPDKVTGRGDVLKLTCPFHADRSPQNDSLVINVFSGFWHCMNSECKEHGNARDWTKKQEGLDDDEALAFVNMAVYGVAEPSIDLVVTTCHENLTHRKFIMADLEARRGWTKQTILDMNLGWDGSKVIIPVPNTDGSGWATYKKYNYNPTTEGQRRAKNVALAGHGSHLYPYSATKLKEIFVVEGEPDTILTRQHGWNALSNTAGAGNFKREWAEMMSGATVYIAMDNDIEGAAGTNIVALHVVAFAAHVFVLQPPKEHNGKPVKDWTDLLIKTGVEPEDRAELLQKLKTTAIPYSTWAADSPDAQRVSDAVLPDGLVIREGCYCRRVAKEDGEGFDYRPISNFVFEGQELLEYENSDLESVVRVVHRDGSRSAEFSVSGDDWARPDRLTAKIVARHPGATLDTRKQDLGLIQQHVYGMVKNLKTKVLNFGGYIPELDVWVWKNGVVGSDGVFVKAEEGRALAITASSHGPLQLRINPRLEFNLPAFSPTHPMSDETLSTLIRAMWQHHGLAWILYLGTSFSSAYADVMGNKYYFSPLGLISGGPASGKSTIVSYAMNLWNFSQGLSEATRNDSTKASFSRRLAFFSNLPVWLDEIQTTPFIDNELLKGIYNRTSRPISATGGGIINIPTRATLFMSGEYTNFDQAVMERSISLHISKSTQSEQAWEQIRSLYSELPSLGYRAILQRIHHKDVVLQEIDSLQRHFKSQGVEQRFALNYAIATAPLLYELGQTGILTQNELTTIRDAILAHLKGSEEESKDTDTLELFFNDFVQMANSKQVILGEHYWQPNGCLVFNLPAVHAAWEVYCRSRNRSTMLSRIEILHRLRRATYCETADKRASLEGKTRRVVVINMTHSDTPECLSELNDAKHLVALPPIQVGTSPQRQPGSN